MLSRVPYVHWFRTVKNMLVAAGFLIVKFCLLGLLDEHLRQGVLIGG